MVHWTVGFQLFWFTKICHELISQREILNLPPCWRVGKGFVWAHSEQSIKDFWSWYKRANVAKKKNNPELHKTLEQQCANYCVYHGKDMWYFKNLCHFICLVDVQDTLAITLSLLFGFFGLEQRFKISCFSPKTVLANFPASWLVLWCRDCS